MHTKTPNAVLLPACRDVAMGAEAFTQASDLVIIVEHKLESKQGFYRSHFGSSDLDRSWRKHVDFVKPKARLCSNLACFM